MVDYNDNLYQTPRQLEQIAQLCNEKKMNAKACSERSAELYLAVLIKVSSLSSSCSFPKILFNSQSSQEYGTISDEAVIVGVKDESLDIYLFHIGVPLRVGINVSYANDCSTSFSFLIEFTVGSSTNKFPEIIQ